MPACVLSKILSQTSNQNTRPLPSKVSGGHGVREGVSLLLVLGRWPVIVGVRAGGGG